MPNIRWYPRIIGVEPSIPGEIVIKYSIGKHIDYSGKSYPGVNDFEVMWSGEDYFMPQKLEDQIKAWIEDVIGVGGG